VRAIVAANDPKVAVKRLKELMKTN
jgi:hypothetical protein